MGAIDISLIIPIYNVETFLKECLESVLHQTIDRTRLEVILVDDGSTDNSGRIASAYAEKYDHFMCIHQKNGGLSAARNTGLNIARGQYIAFLDSDDTLKPHALKTLYTEGVQDDAELILFGAENFEENQTADQGITEAILYRSNYGSAMEGYKLYKKMYVSKDLIISACWVMVSKDLIDRNHIRFIEGIQYEDHWYNFLVLLYAERAKVVNVPLYNRRIRIGSIMTENNYEKKFQGMFSTLIKLDELRSKNNFTKERKEDVELEIIRISAHILNTLVQMEYNQNDSGQLREFRNILRKSQFWRKVCLTVTALFGVKAGTWVRKSIGK